MESDDMNSRCRLCGNSADIMVDILNTDKDNHSSKNKTTEPNMLEIIQNCLPVQISNFDGLPKVVCESCCHKSRAVYDFIQLILTTQKMFLKNLDNVELIRTNKTKVVQRYAFDIQPADKQTIRQPSPSDPVQKIFENLRKNRTNVTISKVKCLKPTITTLNEDQLMDPKDEQSKESLKVESLGENSSSDIFTNTNEETNQIIEYYVEYLNDFDQSNDELEVIRKECETSTVASEVPTKPTTTASLATATTTPVTTTKTTSSSSIVPPETVKSKSVKPTVVKMLCEASFVCMTCKINVHTFEELRIHMQTNLACKQINLTCDVCGKVCDSKKSLYQHTLTHKQKSTFVCEECGKMYSNRFNLENHKSSYHGEQVEEYGSIYKCKICDDQFTNRKLLYDHLSNHRKIPSVNLCDTCGKCFDYPEQLRSHVRVHSDHRPFPCTYCEKKFRSRLQQLQHLHVHNGEKQFICMECGKSFAKRGSLVSHSRLHSGETPFACLQCDEKFASPGKLKTHAKYHIVIDDDGAKDGVK